jgi:hypothetical protein
VTPSPAGVRVGVDIGGTFTDIVPHPPRRHAPRQQDSSTPDDPARAVVSGLAALLRGAGIAPASVSEIVHGTTVGSNAVLQKKGAATGLLTTRGFRDVLEIGRIRTPDLFDLTWDKPVPLVERRRRLEVDERMGADGSVVHPLDPASVHAAVDRLVKDGVEVIAICFINSYVNPAHERETERLIRQRHPGLEVSASYRVLPEIKEYERTSTTVVNAYLLPIMRRYLDNLVEGLRGIGIQAPLLVIASNGGVVGARAAADKPVFCVQSGAISRRGRRSEAEPSGWATALAPLGFIFHIRSPRSPDGRLAFGGGSGCGLRLAKHRLRHGRHHRQGLAGGRRARLAHLRVRVPRGHQHAEPLHQGRRLHAEGARHRHRGGGGGRGLHRLDRRRRPPPRGAGVSGRGAGPRLLCHRRNAAHRHRRQCGPGLPESGISGRRRAEAGCRPGRGRHPRAGGGSAGAQRRRGGSRHPRGGERQHGASHPVGDHRARPRSARLHPGGLRR